MHIRDLYSLRNKCAVVVGGAGKIGFAISEALAEAGANVCIVSTNKENNVRAAEKLKNKGLSVQGFEMDQSNEQSVFSCLEEVTKEFKTPDILVNCAIARPMKKNFEDSAENWDKSMAVNSGGLFIICRAFAKAMTKQGHGSIINISSIYGLVAPDQNLYEGTELQTDPDYPFAKGGMHMLSKHLASIFAKDNVRVNCIAPGGFFNNQPEPFLGRYLKKVPMGRMAETDDIKGIAVFLASDASKYITGAIIPLDGGLTIV